MKNSNLKSIFDQTGQKKIENNLGKGLFFVAIKSLTEIKVLI